MKNDSYLIFDFDGTLVDSFRIVIEKFNLLSDEFNFKKINAEEIDGLRDLTSQELIKYLKIPPYKIPRVLRCARKHMQKEMHRLPTFTGLSEILEKLRSMGFTLGILSSNSSENIIAWLELNNFQHLFNFIYGESHFFGKKYLLKKMLKSCGMNKARTFYIGDETRDIEAAKQSNVFSVAVTWGFNSEKILLQCQPHYIISNPEGLLKIASDKRMLSS